MPTKTRKPKRPKPGTPEYDAARANNQRNKYPITGLRLSAGDRQLLDSLAERLAQPKTSVVSAAIRAANADFDRFAKKIHAT